VPWRHCQGADEQDLWTLSLLRICLCGEGTEVVVGAHGLHDLEARELIIGLISVPQFPIQEKKVELLWWWSSGLPSLPLAVSISEVTHLCHFSLLCLFLPCGSLPQEQRA
jgi:hypothetical protein